MNEWRQRMTFLFRRGLIALLLFALAGYLSLDFIVDLWWYDTLDSGQYFILRQFYRDTIAVLTTLIFVFVIYLNFSLVPKFSSPDSAIHRPDPNRRFGPLLQRIKARPVKTYLPVAVLLTIPTLIPIYTDWEAFLLFLFSPDAGFEDPVYGKDIGFYLFVYPVLAPIQNNLMLTLSLLAVLLFLYYRIGHQPEWKGETRLPTAAQNHLSVLIGIIVLIEAWSIALKRIALLYEDRHLPVFFGPGFVEMNWELPLIWLTFLAFAGAALLVIVYLHRRTHLRAAVGFGLAYLALIGLRQFPLIPEMIDKYYVSPNPASTEKKYMEYHIQSTLSAYGIDRVKTIDYPVTSSLTRATRVSVRKELHNIPVWDEDLLQDVYNQLQGIRPYFVFTDIDVDRYAIDGHLRQVNLAVRELNLDKLPPEARSWENQHLVYTHGYGAAVSPSDQEGGQPMAWYLSDLTLSSTVGLSIERPEIYFGLSDYDYAVVPNNVEQAEFTAYGENRQREYQGTAGLRVASLLHRSILAAYLGDSKFLLSPNITSKSQVLIRRNIIERIRTFAPYLQLDGDPYAVITAKGVFWIVDAYTTSSNYPGALPVPSPFSRTKEGEEPEKINYIRNSVKIVVDAYQGKLDFYIVDPSDPVIRAYDIAYPGLLRPFEDMPEELIPHLRYPRDLFDLQTRVYARYHQQQAETFYQQSETLQPAEIDYRAVAPYYLTLDLTRGPDGAKSWNERFVLVRPMTPINSDNLQMLLVAGCLDAERCDRRYAGDIVAYQFPKDIQLEGPAQISALIDQDTTISTQFSLWSQRGSEVIRGRIIIVPVEKSILYIQPIYLAASGTTRFPQLTRVIVAMNHQVAMDINLEAAFSQLESKLVSSGQTDIITSSPQLQATNVLSGTRNAGRSAPH